MKKEKNLRIILKQLNELDKKSFKMRLAAENWDKKWKTLIATILSARTRDEKTIPIAGNLFKKYNTLKKLSKGKLKDVKKIIKPINFYKTKSKNIINCAKILVKDYKSEVPNVFLAEYGHNKIGVDTHLSYISQELGWTKNKNPHKIEKDLQILFPRKYWKILNSILVRFGKTYTSRREKKIILEEIRKMK